MTTLQIAAPLHEVQPLLAGHLPSGMTADLEESPCNRAGNETGTRMTLSGGKARERVEFAGLFTVIVRKNALPYMALSRWEVNRRGALAAQRGAGA